jgi:hypothetical protein
VNRSGERLVIVGLVAFAVLLITIPAIGDFLRGVFVSVLGSTLASVFAGIANIIGVAGFLFLLVRWISAGRGSSTRTLSQGQDTPTGRPDAEGGRRRQRCSAEAQRLRHRVREA